MRKKKDTTTAEAVEQAAPAQPETAKQPEAPTAPTGSRVYCGPSVRGVARQYTVFAGEIPAALSEFVAQHPAASGLIVPTSLFAQTRKRLETAGSAEAILYQKIKSEL